ncbi:MAG: hypothetical protein ABIH99_05890 [Candidatus Micrarchaeota archaeon]
MFAVGKGGTFRPPVHESARSAFLGIKPKADARFAFSGRSFEKRVNNKELEKLFCGIKRIKRAMGSSNGDEELSLEKAEEAMQEVARIACSSKEMMKILLSEIDAVKNCACKIYLLSNVLTPAENMDVAKSVFRRMNRMRSHAFEEKYGKTCGTLVFRAIALTSIALNAKNHEIGNKAKENAEKVFAKMGKDGRKRNGNGNELLGIVSYMEESLGIERAKRVSRNSW